MEPGSISGKTQLVLTFLPLIAIVVTAVSLQLTNGRIRWLCAALLPAAFAALSWWSAPAMGYNGNLLGALLFVVGFVLLVVYYPILLISAIVHGIRHSNARAKAPSPS